MFRRLTIAAVATATALVLTPADGMADQPGFTPGAPGVGDPYGPFDGNGGYQVDRYLLDLTFNPATDLLAGSVTITAEATQNLSRFDLDFDNVMTVDEVTVDGHAATFTHGEDDELVITPRDGLRDGCQFTVVVRYQGKPVTKDGARGFVHTDDGAVVVNDRRGASTWFPANDHPSDKAAYGFQITVPQGLQAVANGERIDRRTGNGWTTWIWKAREPMTSDASMIAVGRFDLSSSQVDGIDVTNAIDPALFTRLVPRTGDGYAITREADQAYQRLTRTIDVPAAGGQLSFFVDRHTQRNVDFVFVEAHTVGADDWTTLPDLNGHTSTSTGFSCPGLDQLHPFLAHYRTDNGDGTCLSTGRTGAWHAASGRAGQPADYEDWRVDLSGFAGRQVELSISYVTDVEISHVGALVDDVTGPGGQGTTSFEPDADPGDGWHSSGPPPGSPANPNNWIIATAAQGPPSEGEVAAFHLGDRQREIYRFMASRFGPYPFTAGGGLVDNTSFGSSSQQTRSAFDRFSFSGTIFAVRRVPFMHAIQWFGNAVSPARYQDVWLTVGLGSYAAQTFYEHEGSSSTQELSDQVYDLFPADHEFWRTNLLDPLKDPFLATFGRAPLGLHALRALVGDETFFRILRTYIAENKHGNATSQTFFDVAERVSGRNLDELFQTWWIGGSKPPRPVVGGQAASRATAPGKATGMGPLMGR